MSNLIGISGKIGSGKDTVAAIIQFLTAQDYSTACEDLLKNGVSIDGHHNSRYKIKKFAGKLKMIASLLTGIPVDKFEDRKFKEEELGEEWSYPYPGEFHEDGSPVMMPMTVRQLLQELGTEAMREGLHTNVWVNALMADYRRPKMDQHNPSYWLVTDTRFPNEADAILENNGILLRIERPGLSTDEHASETALDNYPFTHVIHNDGSMEDLIKKVEQFLIQQNII